MGITFRVFYRRVFSKPQVIKTETTKSKGLAVYVILIILELVHF